MLSQFEVGKAYFATMGMYHIKVRVVKKTACYVTFQLSDTAVRALHFKSHQVQRRYKVMNGIEEVSTLYGTSQVPQYNWIVSSASLAE